jgi:hypothetical protein
MLAMKQLSILLLILMLMTGCGGAPSGYNGNGNGDSADTTSPIITEVAISDITETSAVITWNTNEPCDSLVMYGISTTYGIMDTLSSTLVTSHTMNLTGLIPDAVYHFHVKSSDASGNQTVSDFYSFTTDTTPPIIT